MNLRKMIAAFTIGTSLLLGGCMNMDGSNHDSSQKSNEAKNGEEQHNNKDIYVSVQDYTGQQYQLPNGEENDKIAEDHRDVIKKAVKKFFLDKYKTKVKVHNIVGNKDGATVFVESIGEPHFHTFAIVPINTEGKEILTDQIFSQEGEIESDIRSGLYKMVNEKAFNHLDKYLDKFVKKYPVVGKTPEAINNTGTIGYMTPYYYVAVPSDSMTPLYKAYLKNPRITQKQLQEQYHSMEVDSKDILITIQLFMEKKHAKPDKEIFKMICNDIKQSTEFPKGSYNVLLNDNRVIKRTGTGSKDNSLDKGYPNSIIKR